MIALIVSKFLFAKVFVVARLVVATRAKSKNGIFRARFSALQAGVFSLVRPSKFDWRMFFDVRGAGVDFKVGLNVVHLVGVNVMDYLRWARDASHYAMLACPSTLSTDVNVPIFPETMSSERCLHVRIVAFPLGVSHA